MRARAARALAACGLVAALSGLTACGGSSGKRAGPATSPTANATGPKAKATSPEANLSGPVSPLASIANTSANRSLIVVNDLAGMWRSAGFPFPPSQHAAFGTAATSPSLELVAGSPLGSVLWTTFAAHPFGYNPLAVSSEVVVGNPPDQLSEVTGSISAPLTRAALGRVGLHGRTSAGSVQYLVPRKLGSPDAATFATIGRVDVPDHGGRLVVGGITSAEASVMDLLSGRRLGDSLVSDPTVGRMLSLLHGSQVMAMGTSFVTSLTSVLGNRVSAAQLKVLADRYGLDRLPAAPAFAGFGYLPGKPVGATAIAAAIYPSPSDAKGALPVMRTLLEQAVSPITNSSYSKLWRVRAIAVNGDALVARLTMLHAGALSQAVPQDDIPLFWGPVSAHS